MAKRKKCKKVCKCRKKPARRVYVTTNPDTSVPVSRDGMRTIVTRSY